MSGKKHPKRGEIYWVEFDPSVGKETQKTRLGLIVSNDIGNEVSDLVMIAPITSKIDRLYPVEVKITLSGKEGKIMLNQCICKIRFCKYNAFTVISPVGENVNSPV